MKLSRFKRLGRKNFIRVLSIRIKSGFKTL
jgi:hypothetical protein